MSGALSNTAALDMHYSIESKVCHELSNVPGTCKYFFIMKCLHELIPIDFLHCVTKLAVSFLHHFLAQLAYNYACSNPCKACAILTNMVGGAGCRTMIMGTMEDTTRTRRIGLRTPLAPERHPLTTGRLGLHGAALAVRGRSGPHPQSVVEGTDCAAC